MTKTTLSETDICDKFITPAVQKAGWDLHEQIFRQYTLRPGRVVVRGRTSSRDPAPYCVLTTCVDSLRRLCAGVRQRLSASQTTEARLADALVQQAA